jgi:hypothetical protein
MVIRADPKHGGHVRMNHARTFSHATQSHCCASYLQVFLKHHQQHQVIHQNFTDQHDMRLFYESTYG